jgi:hypothetical protein
MEDYRLKPPGLSRRLAYSRLLLRRQNASIIMDLSYETLSSLEPVYIGLSKYEIIIHTDMTLNMNTDNFCSICQHNIGRFGLTRILNCGHNFHNTCLVNYCKFYNKCPLCRASICS